MTELLVLDASGRHYVGPSASLINDIASNSLAS